MRVNVVSGQIETGHHGGMEGLGAGPMQGMGDQFVAESAVVDLQAFQALGQGAGCQDMVQHDPPPAVQNRKALVPRSVVFQHALGPGGEGGIADIGGVAPDDA